MKSKTIFVESLSGGCILIRYRNDKYTVYAMPFYGDNKIMFRKLSDLSRRCKDIDRIKINYSGNITIKKGESLEYDHNGLTIYDNR